MGRKISGRNQVSGTRGKLWWNNEPVIEVKAFEAKITANREDVLIGMSNDSKLMSLTGEGTWTLKKMFTRHKKAILDAWKKDEDIRFTLRGVLDDPDTVGKQKESVVINNVWINELPLLLFEHGSLVEEEFSFGFTPDSADFEDIINVA